MMVTLPIMSIIGLGTEQGPMSIICLYCNMIIDFSHLAFLRYYELIKEDSDFYIICY